MRTLALLAFALATPASGATLTIACGRVYDSERASLLGPHRIEIRDGRIHALVPGSGAADVDHSRHTCLPGLIDLHVHLSNAEAGPASYTEGTRMNAADYALRAAAGARRTLRAGFTTVRDLGESEGAVTALRNAIAEGIAEGPRIHAAGKSIATTGGHADPTNGRSLALMGNPGPNEGVINGADQARAAVRQRYKEGADLIKVTATGGVLSNARLGSNPQFTAAELQAVVETARDYGMAVAAHAHGNEGIRRAVLAGVTTIEHGSYLDADTMALMNERGTWLVPTLMAGWWVTERADQFPPMVAAKARAIGPLLRRNLAAAWKAGVPIAFGTDSGVPPHGLNAREFELMVEAGMPAAAALQSATYHAAQALDAAADIGSLQAGRYADLVIVDGDPLADIRLLQRPLMTYKAGVAYAPLPTP